MLFKYWLVPDNPPKNPDCFVVLSYAVKDKSTPTKPTKAAIKAAYNWWKKYPKAKVIMSTGDNQELGLSNAEVMTKYVVKLGIPRENIIIEEKSLNTHENLFLSGKMLKARKLKRPTIVAYDLHMRRILATAGKLGWKKFYWVSAHSKGEPSYGTKWIQTYSRLTIFVYELLATIYSRLVGWI